MGDRIVGEIEWIELSDSRLDFHVLGAGQEQDWPDQVEKIDRHQPCSERCFWRERLPGKTDSVMPDKHDGGTLPRSGA